MKNNNYRKDEDQYGVNNLTYMNDDEEQYLQSNSHSQLQRYRGYNNKDNQESHSLLTFPSTQQKLYSFESNNIRNNRQKRHINILSDNNKSAGDQSDSFQLLKRTASDESISLNKQLKSTFRKYNSNYSLFKIPISKNETLHSISLKYKCPVWELKRANHLWGSQEIHARSCLLVPAAENSLRAELLLKDGRVLQESGYHIDLSSDLDLAVNSPNISGDRSVRPVSISSTDCQQFLQTLDADLEKIKQGTCFLKDSDEVSDYLTRDTIRPVQRSWMDKLKLSGADLGGVTWPALVGILVAVCLLLPLIVFLLLRTHEHH